MDTQEKRSPSSDQAQLSSEVIGLDGLELQEEVYSQAPAFAIPPLPALEFSAPVDDLEEVSSDRTVTAAIPQAAMAEASVSRLAHRFAPTSPPTLVSIFPESGTRYELQSDQTIVIGRDPRRSDLVLFNPSVSQKHCQLVVDDEECTLIDLGSSNGTYVNGERITSSRILRQGDLVTIGRFVFIFLWYRFAPKAQPEILYSNTIVSLMSRLYPTPASVQSLLLASNLFSLPVDITKGTMFQIWGRVMAAMKRQDFMGSLKNLLSCAVRTHPNSTELSNLQDTILHWEANRNERGVQERVNIDVKNSMLLVRELLSHHTDGADEGSQELLEDEDAEAKIGMAPPENRTADGRGLPRPTVAPEELPFEIKPDESGAFLLPTSLVPPAAAAARLRTTAAPGTIAPPTPAPSLTAEDGEAHPEWFNQPSTMLDIREAAQAAAGHEPKPDVAPQPAASHPSSDAAPASEATRPAADTAAQASSGSTGKEDAAASAPSDATKSATGHDDSAASAAAGAVSGAAATRPSIEHEITEDLAQRSDRDGSAGQGDEARNATTALSGGSAGAESATSASADDRPDSATAAAQAARGASSPTESAPPRAEVEEELKMASVEPLDDSAPTDDSLPPPPVPDSSRQDLVAEEGFQSLQMGMTTAPGKKEEAPVPWDEEPQAPKRNPWMLPLIGIALLSIGIVTIPPLFVKDAPEAPATVGQVAQAPGAATTAENAVPNPADAKPADPVAEVKPADVKPADPVAEAKPAEVKPAEVKPAEVKPAEVKPAEVKPAAASGGVPVKPSFEVINFLGQDEKPKFTQTTAPKGAVWDSKTNQITAGSLKDCQWLDNKTAVFQSKGGRTFRFVRCSTGQADVEGWVVEAGMK